MRLTYSEEMTLWRVNGKLNHKKTWGWDEKGCCKQKQQMLRPSGQSKQPPGTNQMDRVAAVWGRRGNGLLLGRGEDVSPVACLCRLDNCELTHTCCQVIAQMLVTPISLKSLSLAGNKVTDQSIKSLCDALKVTQCTLQKLM